eukprot:scaffold73910_cov37-Attheya_sp.AAC.6
MVHHRYGEIQQNFNSLTFRNFTSTLALVQRAGLGPSTESGVHVQRKTAVSSRQAGTGMAGGRSLLKRIFIDWRRPRARQAGGGE